MSINVETIEINGQKYIRADLAPPLAKGPTGPIVLVRCTGAGVHFGEQVSFDAATQTVVLRNPQRLWKWQGAKTLNEVVTAGVTKGNISAPVVGDAIITGVHEVLPVTAKALATLSTPKWDA